LVGLWLAHPAQNLGHGNHIDEARRLAWKAHGQRIESFLADGLALAGEDPDAVREG